MPKLGFLIKTGLARGGEKPGFYEFCSGERARCPFHRKKYCVERASCPFQNLIEKTFAINIL